jgi:hypothetical protein
MPARSTKTSYKRRTTSVKRQGTSRAARRPIAPPHRRILGLRWHHFSALSLVILGIAWSAIAVIAQPSQVGNALPPLASGQQWNLAWGDEFNGSSVDTGKWNVQNNSNYGSSNHEDECYEAANVSEGGGVLNLNARRQTVSCGGTNPDTGNSTYYFTSGMITTRAQGGPMNYKFKQGYIEARMRAPKGNPYWPAFWLASPGDGSTPGWPDYGEFDISEIYGARPDATFGTMHYACTSGACQTAANVYNIASGSAYGGLSNYGTQMNDANTFDSYSGATTSFHTYGLLWEANHITWYVDGRAVRYFDGKGVYRYESNGSTTLENSVCSGAMACPTIDMSTVFNYEHSIIFNLAFGGNGPRYSYYGYTGQDTASGYSNGNLVATIPDSMQIDYVHVYQAGAVPTPPPTTPPPSGGGGGTGGTTTPPPSTGGSQGTTTPPTNSGGTVLTGGTSSNTPKPVSGTVLVTPSTPGDKVSVQVDGKPLDSTSINTKDLTNGVHTVTITENGKTSEQKILVHNPWPTALLNTLQTHKVLCGALASGVAVLAVGTWFGRLEILHWLRNRVPDNFVRFSGEGVVPAHKK